MIMETYKLPNGDEFYRNSKGEFIYQDGRKMV